MRKIQLPKVAIIRWTNEKSNVEEYSQDVDYTKDMAVIEKNGSEILSATVMLEDRMIEGASKLLFGTGSANIAKREFFVNEIMSTSDFSFAFKRRVFTRLLEQFQVIENERIKSLKAGLQKIMLWRNAFAHGQVIHELNGNFVLHYYSGGHQELTLNDKFFENVESTIRECLYICNGIIQSSNG